MSRDVSKAQGLAWVLPLVGPVRRRIHDMGLLPRLLIAEVLVFAMVFAGGVFLIDQMANSLSDRIRQERLLVGRAIAEDLDASLGHSVTELQQLAMGYLLAVARGAPGDIQGSLDLLAGESAMFTRGIRVVGPGGGVLGADQRHPGVAEIDLQRHWPSLWDEGMEVTTVQAVAFQVEGQATPTVAIAFPVGGGRNGEYVVGLVDTAYSYPAQIVHRAVRLGGSGHADIVDQGGVALFSTQPDHLLRTSDHPTSYRRLSGQAEPIVAEFPHEGEVEAGSEDEPHLMAFVPLRAMPWTLSIGTSVSEAFAPVRQLWLGGLGLMALFTGLAFTATVFVGRRLVQPVKALSVAARRVAAGERGMSVRIPWGGEIGELASSLETMRLHLQAWGSELEEQVQQRTAELEERNRELRALYETLQRNEEQLRALLGKVLGAQEDERKRVSRELHDGIGQALSAMSLGLERLDQAGPEQWPHLQQHLEALRQLATSTLSDLRRLTIALRPAALDDLGLVPALRRYAELLLGNAGIDFQVQEEGLDPRLDPSLETVVYRVVQEAINNVARHSGATRARVRLQSTEGGLAVTVEDNGQGFDPALATSKQGVGLQGMAERASLAGGKLTVNSQPGHGTTVRLVIPLAERAGTPEDV